MKMKSKEIKLKMDDFGWFILMYNWYKAEKREGQFKKWKRDWKIKLIEEMNPS